MNPIEAPPDRRAETISLRLRAARLRGLSRRRFRGGIDAYLRTITLGDGYIGSWADDNLCRNCRAKGIQKCRHFELDTAKQLTGPLRAIADENVRTSMVLKSAQGGGSLSWDLGAHFLLVHTSYKRIKALLDCQEKADIYCKRRFMETIRTNPDLAPLVPTGFGRDRHEATTNEIKFKNGKVVEVLGLNDTNASSLPSDVIIIDEGWLHQADGLMRKAIDRTKQVKNRKIIIVGQAGDVKEDQDNIWNGLHVRVPLTWACPCCGGRQQFELHKRRPADFTPRVVSSDEWRQVSQKYSATLGELLPMPPPVPKAGDYCGFKIAKRISELSTPEEIKAVCAATTIECYFCGFHIADTKEMRWALNNSFEQEYRMRGPNGILYTPMDYSVGFWNPDPSSMFVSFRETMQAYVEAMKAKDDGNRVPIRDFYLSRWAQPWDEALENRKRALEITPGSYETDPNKRSFGDQFHCRQLTVDCGKDAEATAQENIVGKFFFEVRDFDKRGNSRQLARGMVESWELLAAQQRFWKVPCKRVFIDAAWMPTQVMEAAAKYFELAPPAAKFQLPSTWRLCWGAPGKKIGQKGKAFVETAIPGIWKAHDKSGKLWQMSLQKITWLNYWFEDQFESILLKTVNVQWEILPPEKLVIVGIDEKPDAELTRKYLEFECDSGSTFRSWSSGLNSRFLDPKSNKYEDINKQGNAMGHWTEPRDCGLMQLVGVAADGLLGHVSTGAEEGK